mgnify:CR=1 FL=1
MLFRSVASRSPFDALDKAQLLTLDAPPAQPAPSSRPLSSPSFPRPVSDRMVRDSPPPTRARFSNAPSLTQANVPSSASKRPRSPSPGRSSPAQAAGGGGGGGGSPPPSSAPPSSLPASSPPPGFSDIDDDGVEEDGIRTDGTDGEGEEEGEGEDLFDENMGK